MDFYLTEIKANNKTGTKIHFPMNPEQVTLTMGVITQDYTIMNLGEVRIPYGNKLDQISWDGKLPGAKRKKSSFVKDWKDPSGLFAILKKWKKAGATLRLLVTGTPINMDVFIETMEPKWGGGFGDLDYTITLTEYKQLKVYNTKDQKKAATPSKPSRPSQPSKKTYTIKPGDTLWKIAQKELGSGSRYTEIYKINKALIGSNPNKLKTGQVLTLP